MLMRICGADVDFEVLCVCVCLTDDAAVFALEGGAGAGDGSTGRAAAVTV